MKLNFLLFAFLIGSISSYGQRTGDITVYSNTGKKFYVILNGIRQNITPQTNVNITGLANDWYACRILAEDKSFNIEKNIAVKKDSLVNYRILEKKGKYKLRFYSESSLGTAVHPENQVSIVYTESNPTTTINNQSNSTVIRTTGSNIGNENVNLEVNVSGTSIQTNSSVKGNQGQLGHSTTQSNNQTTVNSSNSTYTETVTTTTTQTQNGITTNTHSEETTTATSTNNAYPNQINVSGESEGNLYIDDDVSITLSSNNCLTTDADVANIKRLGEKETFREDKLNVVLAATKPKCMTVEQIKSLTGLFTFSEDKMTFIKASHTNCMNRQDYSLLAEIFTFSADKEELIKFVESH